MERTHRRDNFMTASEATPPPPPPPSPRRSSINVSKKRELYVITQDEFSRSGGELLAVPAGWLVKLVAFQVELITSSLLSLLSPFLSISFAWKSVPSSITRLLRRLAFGLLGAVYAAAVLFAVMIVAVVLSVALVRLWMEEPVVLRKQLNFDYTQANPSAVAVLGQKRRAVPVGHTLRVSLVLRLPESDFNRQIGIFQVNAEAVSSSGELIVASSQPCSFWFRSSPVQLARTALMSIPLLLGFCSESQEINVEILKYREISKHPSEMIIVTLKPRSGTADLPQIYQAQIVAKTQLPWLKELVYKWRWTLYLWVSLSVFLILLIILFCCFKPFAISRVRGHGVERQMEKGLQKNGLERAGEQLSYEPSAAAAVSRRWRARGKRKVIAPPEESLPESTEGSASSAVGAAEACEVIDDRCSDLAASESSECVVG